MRKEEEAWLLVGKNNNAREEGGGDGWPHVQFRNKLKLSLAFLQRTCMKESSAPWRASTRGCHAVPEQNAALPSRTPICASRSMSMEESTVAFLAA